MLLTLVLSSLCLILLTGCQLMMIVEAWSHGLKIHWFDWIITILGLICGVYLQKLAIDMLG